MTEPGSDLPPAIEAAVGHHRAGRLEEAEIAYRAVLARWPEQADALHLLGVLAHQRGRADEAVALIERAIELTPDHADALSNLGNVLKEQGRAAEAQRAYERAIEARPDFADPHNNLGTILRGRGRVDDAVAAFRRALALRPGFPAAHQNLAVTLAEHGPIEEAVVALRAWLADVPDDPVALHLLAGCTGGDATGRAGDAFVRRTFDLFARDFDETLARLDYRGPPLIATAMDAALGEPAGDRDVLDAGCGTGLCGAVLRPYARRLVGVDLSRPMLERARSRAVYDELVAGELTAWLERAQEAYDVIVAADTLVYFGALERVLTAAAGALRTGGVLLCSLERIAPEGADRSLAPSGRYRHGERYVRRTLAAAGFDAVDLARAHLRREGGRPVEGIIVRARRGG